MELATCPQCGSKYIQPENIKDTVLDKSTTEYVCKVCGYQGIPLILEKYEGIFHGIKSAVPGFIGPWEIQTRLDNNELKTLMMVWKDARDCVRSLKLKKGDRITVTVDEKVWCIEKMKNKKKANS